MKNSVIFLLIILLRNIFVIIIILYTNKRSSNVRNLMKMTLSIDYLP